MSRIVLSGIDKHYGANRVLNKVSLVVDDGDFMTLLGPSGCGKTTMLRIISGLEQPHSGTISIDDKEFVNVKKSIFESPAERDLSMVFQTYALWPHMTVFDNIAFGLSVKKMSKNEISQKVSNALERMRICELAKKYPSELSGGQQQRVAIARAIVLSSKVLLLDEPLSNLDAKLRMDMRIEFKRLHQEMGTTVIYVTHDQVEALTMSTKIAILFDGILEQVDTPMNIYNNPVTLRTADFIGNPRINFIQGKAQRSNNQLTVESAIGFFRFERETFTEFMPPGRWMGDCVIGIRPEQIDISRSKIEDGIQARIYSCMPAGSETLLQIAIGKESILTKQIGIKNYAVDQIIWIRIIPEVINVYHKDSGRLIKKAAPVAD